MKMPNPIAIRFAKLIFSILSITVLGVIFAMISHDHKLLILSAGIRVFRGLERSAFNYILASIIFVLMVGASLLAVDFSSILAILLCGVLGIAVTYTARLKKGGDK